MNNVELVNHVANAFGFTKAVAKEVVDNVFDAITDSLAKGDEVSVAGFGKFVVTKRDARPGRNPATGAEILIAASKKATFKPAKALKEAL